MYIFILFYWTPVAAVLKNKVKGRRLTTNKGKRLKILQREAWASPVCASCIFDQVVPVEHSRWAQIITHLRAPR